MELSVGVMNVHLRSTFNLQKFSSVVQLQKLDITVVTETWLDLNTSSKIMGKTFGSQFDWFGRERADQKSSSGSGGIGILIRKGIGEVSLIKMYDQFEGMWIKCICGDITLFVCGVYIPPDGSPMLKDFAQCLEILEGDCIKFRKDGKVIVMGDFNARIGRNESLIQGNGGIFTFPRSVSDEKGGGSTMARTRGNQLVNSMNSVNMVIMNGIDSGGEYTFENQNGNSMIDYIILSDNIIIPDNIMLEDKTLDKKSGVVKVTDSIPVNSLYIPKSCRVSTDLMSRIGDHFLVSCKLAISKPSTKVPFLD